MCGRLPTGGMRLGRLDWDHNHLTGQPRGALCRPCNRLVGNYEKRNRPFSRAISENIRSYLEIYEGKL